MTLPLLSLLWVFLCPDGLCPFLPFQNLPKNFDPFFCLFQNLFILYRMNKFFGGQPCGMYNAARPGQRFSAAPLLSRYSRGVHPFQSRKLLAK